LNAFADCFDNTPPTHPLSTATPVAQRRGNTMQTIRTLALFAAALLIWSAAPAAQAQLGDKDRVRCESKDGRRETCDTKWPGQTELVRQLSDTRCIQGNSWGSSAGKVWVDNGCRAEFGPRFAGQEVRCESSDGRFKECGRNLYGNADLIRQLSDTPCREGSSWGLRNGAIWVDKGCRGVFRVGESSGRASLTCASENGRRQTCAWDRKQGTPTLLETLSKSPCVSGKSWGYDKKTGMLWVDEGCRGRFGLR
jgi:Protein of unknown function (DUF3011)